MISQPQLVKELVNTWHQTIPLSQFMQVDVVAFEEAGAMSPLNNKLQHEPTSEPPNSPLWQLVTTAPLAPNINLHQTMFAGSIYTLMTLTGWGMIWLQQQLNQLDGNIVLADAKVKYLAPVTGQPHAKVIWNNLDLSPLKTANKVKIPLQVELWCGNTLCANFSGVYVSLPPAI
ncbi:thioesterase domain-containing protein [Shewanella gaetbuli]|uniref:Thioesterase domain-containing protein n=1 Tax=Shewanella gaetbuli TaxID=220752 RepID=A0A9X1ZJI7_9GAMM|nr:thioesterase domain-containing protein [Shewanella gaetbuli]MCL1143504.1 thioesterase domain-containing protein [Shewanella gaetbuli]